MRITVALSFLAVLCTVEAVPASSTDLEILRLRVRDLKWRVETVMRELQRLRSQTEDDTLDEVTLKWNEEQDSFREYSNLLLTGIRKDTDAAKAAGKNADSCHKNAVDGIEKSVKVSRDDAATCEKTAQNSIQSNLGFLDNLVLTGDTLTTDLDNIFLSCHDSDIYRMQTCINSELANTESSIRTLESDSTTAEITIVPVSKNVIKQASNCFKQAYSTSYTAGATIKMGANECILKATKKSAESF